MNNTKKSGQSRFLFS